MNTTRLPNTQRRRRRSSLNAAGSPVRRFLLNPALHVAILCAILVALGISWDYLFHTAYSTSKFDLRPKVASHVWYFADKRNIINQVFVKNAVAWTLGCLALHTAFSPSRTHHHFFPSRAHRILEILLYMAAWYAVTDWMTSYVRTSTGAICQLPIPPQLANNPSFNQMTTIDERPIVRATAEDTVGPTFIDVPYEYCTYKTLSPSVFPELFSLLRPKTQQLAEEGLYKPISAITLPLHARFFDGFDLSGHVFILFASMAIILRQLAPALRMIFEQSKLLDAPGKKISGARLAAHAVSIVLGLALSVLWAFMLWTTSAYFHTTSEKVAGYLAGLAAIVFLHTISRLASALIPEYFPRP